MASKDGKGVDKGLFEALRNVRATLARERAVPAFIIFGDAALRDMARKRPSTVQRFLDVKGVGETKCRPVRPGHGREDPRLLPRARRRNGSDGRGLTARPSSTISHLRFQI